MKPLLSSLATPYRGPANSEEYNTLFNTVHADLSKLYNISSENAKDIMENMDVLIMENFILQNKIAELQQRVSDVAMSLSDKDGFKYLSKSFVNMHDLSYAIEGTEEIEEKSRLYLDTLHGVILNPIGSSYSRTRATDLNGDSFVNEAVSIEIYEGDTEETKYLVEPDMSPFRLFSSDPSVFWYREKFSSADEIFFTLKIKLFTAATSNNYVNNITLTPFPDLSMLITNITYTDLNGGEHPLPTFPINGIEGFTRTRFAFDKIEAKEITLYGKQSNYFKESNEKKFIYGFKNVDVSYNEYATKQSSIITKFTLDKYNKKFDSISYPTIALGPGSVTNIEDAIEHKLYIVHTNGTTIAEQDFNTTIVQLDCSNAYIVTTVSNVNETSPLLKNLSISFATK